MNLAQAVAFLNTYPSNFQSLSASLQQTQNTLNSANSTLASLIQSGASASTLQTQSALVSSTTATLTSQQSSLATLTASYKQAQSVIAANAVANATGPTGTAFSGTVGFTGPTGSQGAPGASPTGTTGSGGNVSSLDTTPTNGSSNAVTSNGVYQAINALTAPSVSTSMTASNSVVGTLAVANNSLYICTAGFSANSSLDSDSNLAYYIPFDAGSISGSSVTAAVGSSITAVSGNSTSLPSISTTNYACGTGSVSLNTTNQQYISFPSTTIPSNFTISFFLYVPSRPTVDGTKILKFGNVWIQVNGSAAFITFYSNTGYSGYYTLPDAYPTGSWVYVAWVVSGTNWSMYMNGTKYTLTASSNISGQNTTGWMGWSDGTFIGNIDDFRLYNRALTDSEIANLYGRYTGVGTWKAISV